MAQGLGIGRGDFQTLAADPLVRDVTGSDFDMNPGPGKACLEL
jgi:hypothetical protein